MNSKIILGLSWNHDAHASIICDGKILASVGEERLSRIKNHYGFPYKAIKECLKLSNLNPTDIDCVAVANVTAYPAYLNDLWFNQKDTQYDISNSAFWTVKLLLLKHHILRFGRDHEEYNKKYLNKNLKVALKENFINAPIKFFDHHMCHAASAFFSTDFKHGFIAVLDQYGDDKCVSFWSAKNNSLKLVNSYNDVMSPGAFYTEVTKYLGFKRYRHEGKVTGLAAHGDANKLSAEFKKLLKFNPNSTNFSEIRPKIHKSLFGKIFYGLRKLFSNTAYQSTYLTYQEFFLKTCSTSSKEDIAAAAQNVIEDFVLESISYNMAKSDEENICLAGGTFANVLVNQKVGELKKFQNLFVFPNMGDGGLAVGAAQLAFFENKNNFTREFQNNFYLGDVAKEAEIQNTLIHSGLNYETFSDPKLQAKRIASLLQEGLILGLVKGRMEFGPRALCNRSIIASPKDNTINITLNQRLKRTEFMPFAPVIRIENLEKIFPNLRYALPTKYMTITADVDRRFHAKIPAVVHIDGTARPQTVSKTDDPFMHEVLLEFERLTSIPALINTSFNAHEEPIVYTANDAMRAFESGAVDMLVLNNLILYSSEYGDLIS